MEIAPDKQNIDMVFSNISYYIDFYQREYKWTAEAVNRLLDDIFYKFKQAYERYKDLDPSKETITAKYPWYYLSTYVTNTIDGKVYVVDGQQRLTTLILIMIKLYHMSKTFSSRTEKWLESKIAGHSGYEHEFWMNHKRHKQILQDLYEGKKALTEIDTSGGITARNLVDNYQIISNQLESELPVKHIFDTFVFYLLQRVVLINLSVEQTDVPMVFEVINDRGVRLKPYEILKGKLLGQIDKIELDAKDYSGLWEKVVSDINSIAEDEIDNFFRYYLKSKYANTRKEGTRFDSDYHREMFSNDMDQKLHLKHNPNRVKNFLDNEFTYYSKVYNKIRPYWNNISDIVSFNKLNEMDGQFHLMLAGCKLNDGQEDEKLKLIAYEVDRFFSLLQLQNAYDSNAFNDAVYKISSEIRDKDITDIRAVFDKYLTEELSSRQNAEVKSPFQYAFFRNTGVNLNTRFKRYFFARIDKFLADNMNMGMMFDIQALVLKTGTRNGFHVEHILAYNDENLAIFNNNDDLFQQERSRLGGLLLLRGRDNQSSNNECYVDKLRSYANTLYWNQTLREDTYKSKLAITELKEKYGLELEPLSKFGPDELEKRQRLLFKISTLIWA